MLNDRCSRVSWLGRLLAELVKNVGALIRERVLLTLVVVAVSASAGASVEVAAYNYDVEGGESAQTTHGEARSAAAEAISDARAERREVRARGIRLRLADELNAPQTMPSGNRHGLGVSDPPSRVAGPWNDGDLARGALGKPPRSLGSPELHHADQMPGAGIHEIDAVTHRLPGNHPNKWNQGVTDEMRRSDRELHWWYRSQEMGGRDVLGEDYFYD